MSYKWLNPNHHSNIIVNQYSLCGKFIKQHKSIKDAAIELKCHSSSISRAINNQLKTAAKYTWTRQSPKQLLVEL